MKITAAMLLSALLQSPNAHNSLQSIFETDINGNGRLENTYFITPANSSQASRGTLHIFVYEDGEKLFEYRLHGNMYDELYFFPWYRCTEETQQWYKEHRDEVDKDLEFLYDNYEDFLIKLDRQFYGLYFDKEKFVLKPIKLHGVTKLETSTQKQDK